MNLHSNRHTPVDHHRHIGSAETEFFLVIVVVMNLSSSPLCSSEDGMILTGNDSL